MEKNKLLKIRIDEQQENIINEYCLYSKINKSNFIRELINNALNSNYYYNPNIEDEIIDLTSIGKYKYNKKYTKPYELRMADRLNNALYYIIRYATISNINIENIFNKLYSKLISGQFQNIATIRIIDKYNIKHEFLIRTNPNKKEQLMIDETILDLGKQIKIKNEADKYDIINYYTNNCFSYLYIKDCIDNKKDFIEVADSMNINISLKDHYIKINAFTLSRVINSI